jgi:hypothetical protein
LQFATGTIGCSKIKGIQKFETKSPVIRENDVL